MKRGVYRTGERETWSGLVPSFGLLLALTAGCATTPTPTDEAPEVPQSRMLSTNFCEPKSKTAEVTVKRDVGVMGGVCTSRVFADAVPVADLDTGERVIMYLPYGEHIISAQPNGICGGGLSEVSVTLV